LVLAHLITAGDGGLRLVILVQTHQAFHHVVQNRSRNDVRRGGAVQIGGLVVGHQLEHLGPLGSLIFHIPLGLESSAGGEQRGKHQRRRHRESSSFLHEKHDLLCCVVGNRTSKPLLERMISANFKEKTDKKNPNPEPT